MKLEQLKTTPDRAGRYYLKFDNGKSMPVYRQTIEDFGLYSGMELTEDEYERICASASAVSAKMRAVRITAASSVSRSGLKQKLISKGESEKNAAEAVQWLEDLDLIDDRRTAEQIVSICIRRGYGPARAKQALYEKRIPKEYWDDALADYPDQTEAITEFLRGRLGTDSDAREVKRAVDALLRRGHSYSVIREALKNFNSDIPSETEVY